MCPGPHDISLDEAKILTKKYKLSVPPESIRANSFGEKALNDILSQEKCVGLRIYYGITASGEPTLVIVGVDKSRDDLTGGKLAEYGIPDLPPTSSPL
jgi:hypothetical protein